MSWILSLDTGVPLSKRVGREDILKSQPQALIYSQFDINYESFLAYLLLIIANEIFGMKNRFCSMFYWMNRNWRSLWAELMFQTVAHVDSQALLQKRKEL